MKAQSQGEQKPVKNLRGEIETGWYDAGKKFEILGDSIEVNGMRWTPVLYDGHEDPDFLKTHAIKLI